MGKIKVDLTGMYSKATEFSTAESEIAKLQEEVERLRTSQNIELEQQIEALRQQLASQFSVQDLCVNLIQANPDQPRQTFSPESIHAMAQSLLKEGQLQPVIVMPAGDIFQLFDGERRWRAAQVLGWATLKVITMPRPQDLHRKALLTTLHREDLNPLDKAEALLKEINEQTGLSLDEIPRILSTVVRRLDYQKRIKQVSELISSSEAEQKEKLETFELSDSEKAIMLVLLGLRLNPASVCSNDFRMLSLFTDLQKAIREFHLNAAHAMVLQRLSAKKLKKSEKQTERLRVSATQQVIDEKLSLAETKKLVEGLLEKQPPTGDFERNQSSTRAILRGLQKLSLTAVKPSQLLEFRQELLSKLTEVEAELEKVSSDLE